jgi:hypothetical protein
MRIFFDAGIRRLTVDNQYFNGSSLHRGNSSVNPNPAQPSHRNPPAAPADPRRRLHKTRSSAERAAEGQIESASCGGRQRKTRSRPIRRAKQETFTETKKS